MVAGRGALTAVTSFVLGCLAGLKMRAILFDTNYFYGTNIRILTEGLPREFLERTTILSIKEDARPSSALMDVVGKRDAKVILIDDLNSLNSLMSGAGRRPSVHQVYVLVRALSYVARTNDSWVFATIYKGQRGSLNSKRSLSAAADLEINTEAESSRITFRCNHAGIWPDKRFVATRPPLFLGQDVDADVERNCNQKQTDD